MKPGLAPIVLGSTLAALLAASPLPAAATDVQIATPSSSVPVSGSGAGSAQQQATSCSSATYCFNVEGAGRGSPMQSASLTGNVGFFQNTDPTTGRVTGQVTLVDVNNQQNKVYASIDGNATLTPPGSAAPTAPTSNAVGPAPVANVAIAGTYVVVGGEGAYQGATGTGTASGNGVVSSSGNLYQVIGALITLDGAIAVVNPGPATPVPTMSQWALLLLAGILAVFGFRRYRGRDLAS